MKTIDLAAGLGLTPQMTNRLIKQGMPRDLDLAIAWRKSNLQPFRTKSTRIGGNSGKPYQSRQSKPDNLNIETTDQLDNEIVSRALTHILPDLWFSQVQRLDTALKEHGVTLSAETLLDVQGLLFLLYQIEVDRFLGAELVYSIPPILAIRPEHENYNAMIKSLEQCLNRPAAA